MVGWLTFGTPLATVRVVVPDRVPPPALVPMARVIVVLLSVVTTLPLASSTATDTENVPVPVAWMLAPEAGCTVKASWVAAPGVMLKVLLAVVPFAGLLVAFSVYPVPVLL